MKDAKDYTRETWEKEGERRFGRDRMAWRFKCPACGHVASTADYREAGAPSGAVAFSCIGRWTAAPRKCFAEGPGPCDYAGGGLIGLNPVRVSFADAPPEHLFDFADSEQKDNEI